MHTGSRRRLTKNACRPERAVCRFEGCHESKCVSCSMVKDGLQRIFVPWRCLLFVSFVVACFCVLHALSLWEFLFCGSSFGLLLQVLFNYLYVEVWFETWTMCVEADISVSWLCESCSFYDSCDDVTHLPKYKCVTSYSTLHSAMQMIVMSHVFRSLYGQEHVMSHLFES